MDCKLDGNKEQCPCTADDCERKGICCECLRAHLARKTLPACIKKLDWVDVVA